MAKVIEFEPPLLRVSRPVSACQRCRSAKIKCDGKLPSCTACERADRSAQCTSASEDFAKGKERNYVASLENRIERLERQVRQAKERRSSLTMSGVTSKQVERLGFATCRQSDRKEERDIDDLVSDFGFL